jgi:hypothetical protein
MRQTADQDKVFDGLCRAITAAVLPTPTAYITSGLKVAHVLKSPDQLVCAAIASWNDSEDYYRMRQSDEFQAVYQASNLQKLAVEGSLSDFMEKTSPSHGLYRVMDCFIPSEEI